MSPGRKRVSPFRYEEVSWEGYCKFVSGWNLGGSDWNFLVIGGLVGMALEIWEAFRAFFSFVVAVVGAPLFNSLSVTHSLCFCFSAARDIPPTVVLDWLGLAFGWLHIWRRAGNTIDASIVLIVILITFKLYHSIVSDLCFQLFSLS